MEMAFVIVSKYLCLLAHTVSSSCSQVPLIMELVSLNSLGFMVLTFV